MVQVSSFKLGVHVNDMTEFLRATDLGRGLNDEEADKLAGLARDVEYTAGEKVFEQGELNDALFIVRSGVVDIQINRGEGMKFVISMHQGHMFGDMAFVDTRARSGKAKAAVDSQILVFSKEEYDKFAQEEPKAALKVMTNIATVLSARIRSMDK